MAKRLIVLTLLGLLLASTAAAQASESTQEIFKLFRAGKRDACIKACETLLLREPKNATAHHVLGRCLLGSSRTDDAIRHLTWCLELEPRPAWMTAWSHTALGEAYLKKGDRKRARAHLKKAIALNATRNATSTARGLLARLEANGDAPAAPAGTRLPDFAFETLAGRRFGREDLGRRPVILKFGTSW